MHTTWMSAPKSLLVGPINGLQHCRVFVDQIIQRNVAAAPVAVAVVGRGMVIIVGESLANHQRMAGSIGDGRNLDGSLIRLPEEDSATAQVVVTIVQPILVIVRWRLFVDAADIGHSRAIIGETFAVVASGIRVLRE